MHQVPWTLIWYVVQYGSITIFYVVIKDRKINTPNTNIILVRSRSGNPSEHHWSSQCFMMTSSNGNIFRVTGPLCGEFTGPGKFLSPSEEERRQNSKNKINSFRQFIRTHWPRTKYKKQYPRLTLSKRCFPQEHWFHQIHWSLFLRSKLITTQYWFR